MTRRRTVSDVYDRLREDIALGRLEVGAPLVETELAERYGTSRTPVREALTRLEQDGFVERGRRGLQVRAQTPVDILEIHEVRISLDALAAALAAERRTELDLARLEAAAAAMEASGDDGPARVSSNRTFHERLCEAAHNETLVDVVDRLSAQLTRYPASTLLDSGRWERVLAEHRSIIDAIAKKDAGEARSLASEHMRGARDVRIRMYAAFEAEERPPHSTT